MLYGTVLPGGGRGVTAPGRASKIPGTAYCGYPQYTRRRNAFRPALQLAGIVVPAPPLLGTSGISSGHGREGRNGVLEFVRLCADVTLVVRFSVLGGCATHLAKSHNRHEVE